MDKQAFEEMSSLSRPEQAEKGPKIETVLSSKVSSTAIVKYVEELPLLPYSQLRQDTDLNVAPSNWLRDGRFSKTFTTKRNPLEFSSFGIAHTFLDNIGDVDVISDAENIKKLLKMAYSKAELSLVVHRIGKTLLMDDLDLPALLSYISGNHVQSSDLRWLFEFYCEQRGIPKDGLFKKKKNKEDSKHKNIFSKFLHYSVQQEGNSGCSITHEATQTTKTEYEDSTPNPTEVTMESFDAQEQIDYTLDESLQPFASNEPAELKNLQDETLNETLFEHVGQPISFPERFDFGPSSRESMEDDALPEPQQMSSFQRNVLWKFEDLHMLVGTNVPIFGGGKYPAVSLRLRDCGKPINVLTGLDYWLDNLMCNVPEVAMCYHLDGIVQYYDLFKTEDLPTLEGSSFSPKVVKDIAQNVLSFMKSNCTQEGHTYWLFKASDSEVVKLYDLTSICDQKADDKYQNPFTIPVAMLFYRVAKNMMKQDILDASDQSIVKLLLDNCVLLLDDQKFPEIITSANLLLSSLYCPDNIHTLPPPDSSSKDTKQDEFTVDEVTVNQTDAMASKGTLQVQELATPGIYQDDIRKVAKMITSNTEERCKKALSHIVQGLQCLNLGLSTDQETDEMHDVSDVKGSYSVRRITALDPTSQTSTRCNSPGIDKNPLILVKPVQWRAQSKMLLFRKAVSVYHSQACLANTRGKYGRALRYCKLSFLSLHAYRACIRQKQDEEFELVRSLNCACADSYLMLAKSEHMVVHHEDFSHDSPDDRVISHAARETCDEASGFKMEFNFDPRDNLLTSVKLYDEALDQTDKRTTQDEYMSLARRVGNVKNELGVYFMNEAVSMAQQATKLDKQREYWKKSFGFFESGIKAFQSIDDRANMALLYSNSGRLMRLCAQVVGGRVGTNQTSDKEFSTEEKVFFQQSIDYYNRALQILAERKACLEVWDAVTWELSGAYYTMATLLQDFPPLSMLSHQEVEKEVTELMMKALRICEPTGKVSVATVLPSSSGDLQKRIGSIHHRLASLYHNVYRNEISDHAKKKARTLAELHYTKACTYYMPTSFPCEWIRIHLERVAMCEYHFYSHGTGSNPSIKTLESALDFLIKCKEALFALSGIDGTAKRDTEMKEEFGNRNENMDEKGKSSDVVLAKDQSFNKSSQDKQTALDEMASFPPSSESLHNDLQSLTAILESRLNFILKELVKHRKAKKTTKNKDLNQQELDKAKRMYSASLKGSIDLSNESSILSKGIQMAGVLQKISFIRLENKTS